MGLLSRATHGYICPVAGDVTQQITTTGDLQAELQKQGGGLDAELQSRNELDAVVPYVACIPDFEITAFGGPAAVEIGVTVVSPAFTAAYNRPPTSAVLTNDDNAESKDVSGTPTAFTSNLSYQKTAPNDSVSFTLTASEAGPADVDTAAIVWRARLGYGWTTDPGPYTEADLLALNEMTFALDANALFDVTLSPTDGGSGAYLVAFYHDDFNGASPSDFEIGTFGNGDVTEVQTGVSVTIPGGSALYSIARSDFAVEAPGGIRFARES